MWRARLAHRVAVSVVLAGLAPGCGWIEPLPADQERSSELRDRPGIFSGESGTFVWRGRRQANEDAGADEAAPPADGRD